MATVLEFRSTQRLDTADQIIGRATYAISNGNLAHADRWMVAFVQQAEAMEGRSKNDALFGLTKRFGVSLKMFARIVFKSISDPERANALTAVFKRKDSLCPAASLIREQYYAAKKDGHEKEERYYLSDDELTDLVSSQIALYEALTPSDLWKLSSPYDVLFAWNDIADSKGGPATLLAKASKDDGGFLKTLSVLRYVSSSAQKGIARIPEEFLKNLVDIKATKRRLESLAHGKGKHSAIASELLALWWGPEN